MKPLVDNQHTHRLKSDLAGIALFIGLIWVIFVLDRILPLEQLGLVPRSFRGLVGILRCHSYTLISST